MEPEQKKPWRICRVGGRVFLIYKIHNHEHEAIPAYPDFLKNPEYTDDNRPFTSAVYESCVFYKPTTPDAPVSGDCGGCGWFYREETPYDIIGICMCDVLRKKPETKTAEQYPERKEE
jgi:hypothetical protein